MSQTPKQPSFFFWELDSYIITVFVHVYSGEDGDSKVKLADIDIINELKIAASVQFGKDVEVMYLLIVPVFGYLRVDYHM
ncbi:hypothetical protein BDP27DRAFT_1435727 [Rhodocollybia butyracea]|uniref:Uncharacterized protein n=1 Tax=Rhodocollybia butyracea TaxID=206335 RepID=A0A9P5P690_9AGAR|nr:hypothetical protein BDP27DRAFT_1435727 [Rhodocollybia butyracea]